MIDKGICDKVFNLNPSNCECECHKLCDVGKYLDYRNCKCRQRLVNKLVEECNENFDQKKLNPSDIYNSTLNYYKNRCSSCTIDIVFFAISFIISISISRVFIYFH